MPTAKPYWSPTARFSSGSRTYGVSIEGTGYMVNAIGTRIETTAPTADNPDPNTVRIVQLTSEPSVRYNGWWYIITSPTA